MTPEKYLRRQYAPEMLSLASAQVDNHIVNDSKSPLLEEQLNCNVSATVSGMNDFDYPSFPLGDHCSTGTTTEKQLMSIKRVPLPDELVEQFAHMQCNCVMGVFPEISRAWLSIDSDIYFWVYEDGSDVAYYDGIKEVILAAGLIQPKQGMFQEHIKYLLCVTTPTNIYIFGISFSMENPFLLGHSHGNIQLHPEPLFTTSTDNVYMTSVCGTANGRIFLAGKDNSLYEVVYKMQSNWFSKKCYKVNHSASKISFLMPGFLTYVFQSDDSICQLAVDNSRGILYCRTVKGDIKVYNLGSDLNQFQFVAAMNNSAITKQAQYVARSLDYSTFEKVIHLAPVPNTDSMLVHLVAITESGIRLYFTTSPHDFYQPSQLKLVHVRMPGGFAPSLSYERPANIHTAFYRKGTSIVVANGPADMDKLWCFSQDIFPFKTSLKETQSIVHVNGHTWCLTEIPDYSESTSSPIHLFNEEVPDVPSVVTEHILPMRRFVLLSAQGSHLITTLRPLDQLRKLLHASSTGESDNIAAYFRHYGADQACVSCLILICQALESEGQLRELATRAFFRFGGEQQQQHQTGMKPAPMSSYIIGSPIPGGSSSGSFLATPVPQGFQQPVATPSPPNLMNSTAMHQVPAFADGQPSTLPARLNGLFLYFSRIVRPIWNFPLVYSQTVEVQANQQLSSRISQADLSWFIEVLINVKKFLNLHTDIISSQSPTYQHSFSDVSTGEWRSNEKKVFDAFHQLLNLTIEALELWRVLCEHNFACLMENLPHDLKEKFKHLSFKEMLTPSGKELGSHLINSLLSTYLHDNSAVESISTKLRLICPSLYSADDALYSKANEVLLATSLVHNQIEKEKLAQEAIMMYSKIPDLVDLGWICNQLKSNYCYDEIVQLCLTIALKRDSRGIGLHFYKCGEPHEDIDGFEALSMRRESYLHIIETLKELSKYINYHPASALPSKPGPPDNLKDTQFTHEFAMKHFNSMLANCLKSGDELFHMSLYQWLIDTKQTDLLLEIKSTYLEQYLISTASKQHPNNKNVLDLLWKFYERNKNFMAASKILLKLAEREGPTLTIYNRLEYLSRALISMKSCSGTANIDGEFLREIEEKLEVAQVQLKVFDQLSQKHIVGPGKDDALIQLNSQLLDISVLYGDYAERFSLDECKLAIIHCAGHHDNALIEKIWREIIDKAFHENKHLDVDNRMQAISQQIIQCGKMYSQHSQYFPIGYLVYYLECKSCEHAFHKQWVFDIFQQIGVSYSIIMNNYITLYQMKDKTWQRIGRPLHLLTVISNIFSYYLDHPLQSPSERITLTRNLYEVTTSLLVELEAMNTYDNEVKDLLASFKRIQARLKRLL